MTKTEQQRLQIKLLDWYDVHGRTLPWRVWKGRADPYRVWLSEIMLQQTTVTTVTPYFKAFTGRWPTLEALDGAELDDVLHAWQGLGYYARARNLHACAGVVTARHGGRFPDDEKALQSLPGVGAYTAAAISAIAFGRPSAPVDGNIIRVVSRLMHLPQPLPGLKKQVTEAFKPLVPNDRPGDFVQAMMDLGSGICTPTKPLCAECPWKGSCAALKAGVAVDLPIKAPRKAKPTRHGVVFWLRNEAGHILLRKRPEKGLLGGMMEIPSSDWREEAWTPERGIAKAPLAEEWSALDGVVSHTFTHFHLKLTILEGKCARAPVEGEIWSAPERFSDHALPSVMKKIARHALDAL